MVTNPKAAPLEASASISACAHPSEARRYLFLYLLLYLPLVRHSAVMVTLRDRHLVDCHRHLPLPASADDKQLDGEPIYRTETDGRPN